MPPTNPGGEITVRINACLDRMREGDRSAREELLKQACGRLEAITRKIKRTYPELARWEQTDDVFQRATLRLLKALDQVDVRDAQHFFRLAATQIRRELIDLVRHWQGAHGAGRWHATQVGRDQSSSSPDLADIGQVTLNPSHLSEWIEFHESVERLPEPVATVFDLLWYQGLSQEEAAQLLNVDVRTIKRRWREARLTLHSLLESPPSIE
jgi:RNA polymerase sigma-70 factor (ECF subfamily)